MATVTVSQGTAVVWGESGGSGVTKTLSLDALADNSGKQGVYADLGSSWNQEYLVQLIVETGTAPTAGNTVDLYFACSNDASKWPTTVTGADGSYTVGGVSALGPPVCMMVSTTGSSNIEQVQNFVIWRPSARYVAPIIHNRLGQAFRDCTTASDNKSRVILIPLNVTIA